MDDEKYKLNIPVKNVYHMLSYAFGVLKQGGFADLGSEDFENIYDLLSEILIKGIESQIKRGIYKEYLPLTEQLSVLRGKIEISESLKLKVRSSTRLHCSYDDFSSDNLLNQILKSTCFALMRCKGLKDTNKKKLKQLMMYFSEVITQTIHNIEWSQVRYHKNNMTYKMLMNICYLVCEGLIVNEENGTYKFADFIKDKLMATLYEKFVYEFYKKKCKEMYPKIEVKYQQQVKWQSDDGYIDLLPNMNTDISLTSGDHSLIIDTKFYAEAMQKNYFSDNKSLISSNLYQIFAYVKNSGFKGKVSGMLLYPTVNCYICESYKLSGNNIYIRTLDLNREFIDIKRDLISIVDLVL